MLLVVSRNHTPMNPSTVNSFDGDYGLVAVPDERTVEKCHELAEALFPPDLEYVLSPKNLPHITLYHSRFRGLPADRVFELRDTLRGSLAGTPLRLNRLVCFGDKFIFWRVDPESPSYDVLKSAHLETLQLASYLDRSAPRRSDEEGLSLSEAEKENVRRFNHPLVGDSYAPHITLAYGEGAPELVGVKNHVVHWPMRVERVEFAEIGYPGIVSAIVAA